MNAPGPHEHPPSPFDLNRPDLYARWRERKLEQHPEKIEELIVEVTDPHQLTPSEHKGILSRCRRADMAIYVTHAETAPDKEVARDLGTRLGLVHLDHNMGADEDAITSVTVQSDALHRGYIPYSNRPIAWHTDGYYNRPERQIRGMILHCAHAAKTGGENDLLDHEIAYALVRDESPDYIRALMHPQAMTIPANVLDGREVRPIRSGPVFSIDPNGHLHMRYTDRKRNIVWRDDALTKEAVAFLKELLHRDTPWHFKGKLEAGWGLVCNNVLHTRSGFADGGQPRLLYRARYYDRIAGT